MGRRELAEHREQLREGKKWLEAMLAKTDKMLHMVENKMALTGESPAAAHATAPGVTNPSAAASLAVGTATVASRPPDAWDFEERERMRRKEIQRIEEERERDRVERDKREREKAVDRQREQEKTIVAANREGSEAALVAASNRERSEAERNRDFLLASRRVTAVSPNGRERSTPGAIGSTAGVTASAEPGSGPKSATSTWDGNPVMAGSALPRREQGMSRQLGRGLWSFDIGGRA